MEDMYIKPGNQERGWNDPPQFSYGLQMARGPQKNLLNKRATPQTTSGAGFPPRTHPPSQAVPPPPMGGIAPPPLNSGGVTTPFRPVGPTGKCETEASSSQPEPDVEAVMSLLNQALDACKNSVKAQVCSDVAKRLHILEDSWRSGKLSLPVRRRMDHLCQELQSAHWDSADEIHRSLMVDHVTEVHQWMVGVKRLIAETRNLSPELLKPLQTSTRPECVEALQDSAEPGVDSAESAQSQGSQS